ncbi:hypothetical protein [Agrococcus sp. TF02-05]|uniref:hypothetical protein n=1 Tax=Agrococcus sp. TF02-05 TaxID=2815211 RepID=UPI001AA17FF8|nr:hypothetical protein [Agrococcus sp. TF02-05]MBO1770692.1 hypothetical protein [Agrococcus sp. TF02-05]
MRLALERTARAAKDRAAAVLRDRWAAGRFRASTVVGEPGDDGLPVVMCAWKRIDRLGEVLAGLDAQQGSPPLDLGIWNNRRGDHDRLLEAVRSIERRGALRSVTVVRSGFNVGSIGRFYLARRLWLSGRRGPFAVIDDDQRLPQDFFAVAASSYRPGTAAGVWAFRVGEEYWERRRAEPGDRVDHLGPGGMIADLALVSDRAFFDELPLEHWHLDDVWMSHYAPAHGIELVRLPTDVEFVDDDHNIYLGLAEQKVAFHRWLRER